MFSRLGFSVIDGAKYVVHSTPSLALDAREPATDGENTCLSRCVKRFRPLNGNLSKVDPIVEILPPPAGIITRAQPAAVRSQKKNALTRPPWAVRTPLRIHMKTGAASVQSGIVGPGLSMRPKVECVWVLKAAPGRLGKHRYARAETLRPHPALPRFRSSTT